MVVMAMEMHLKFLGLSFVGVQFHSLKPCMDFTKFSGPKNF